MAGKRILAIDTIRGLVILLMALDHVREFWSVTPFRPEDIATASPSLFFTRWITHFCAPAFAFLAGSSIYLKSEIVSKKQLSLFLAGRGLFLIVIQLTLLNFSMQFSYDMIILEIIWALGWAMILMAGLIWLPARVVGMLAVAVIAGHNLIPNTDAVVPPNILRLLMLNQPSVLSFPGLPVVVIAYTIIPWTAIVALGYSLGYWFNLPAAGKVKRFKWTGGTMLTLFFVLRGLNLYGDPSRRIADSGDHFYTLMSFLNVSKYPPSLLFSLMTLGLIFIAIAYADKAAGKLSSLLRTFGEVPFFFFVIHMPLIVLGSHIWILAQGGGWINIAFADPIRWPEFYEPSLLRTYLVWIGYVIFLYFPCKWFSDYKRKNSSGWLSYF